MANSLPVVEFTRNQIVLGAKHAWRFAARVRNERRYPENYYHCDDPPGMFGTTVGVISLGTIGRMVVERLSQYDVNVIAYDPFVDPSEAARLGVQKVSLEKLCLPGRMS